MICEPIKKTLEYMQLYNVQSILEVGCGRGGILAQFHAPVRVGVDNFEPYLIYAKQTFPGPIWLKHDVCQLRELFVEKSFDAVIGFDILEHIHEPQMQQLVQCCEDSARKLVVFFSPLDEIGLEVQPGPAEGNEGMRHVTIIREAAFQSLGYKTITYPDYYGNNATAMLAIKEL